MPSPAVCPRTQSILFSLVTSTTVSHDLHSSYVPVTRSENFPSFQFAWYFFVLQLILSVWGYLGFSWCLPFIHTRSFSPLSTNYSLGSQSPAQSAGRGRDRKILRANWPVSLLPTKVVRLGLMRNPVYKKKVKRKTACVNFWPLHAHVWAHVTFIFIQYVLTKKTIGLEGPDVGAIKIEFWEAPKVPVKLPTWVKWGKVRVGKWLPEGSLLWACLL